MRVDFPSQNGLTWQGQRPNTCPMDSTDNSTDHASEGQNLAEEAGGTLANRKGARHD